MTHMDIPTRLLLITPRVQISLGNRIFDPSPLTFRNFFGNEHNVIDCKPGRYGSI